MRAAFIAIFILLALPARAEFMISNAILEFTTGGPTKQDIELISKDSGDTYIASEIFEIANPGQPNEQRRKIDDPASAGLLVTPDKTVLPAGSRKVMRFVLLKPPDTHEHIYRVTVKPVIKGVNGDGRVGLKILVGYEVLVIVRPAAINTAYNAARRGKTLHIENTGNSNVLFQAGKQCAAPNQCADLPVHRVYAGTQIDVALPQDMPISYAVWDGRETAEKNY